MNWVLGILFATALDLALATALAIVMHDPGGPPVFFITLGILWLIPMVIGVWGIVKFWLAYMLFARSRMIRYYKTEMYKSKFPSSREFFDWQSYLTYLLNDTSVNAGVKTKAAAFASEIQTYRTVRPATLFLGTQFALDKAIEDYQAPPSTSGMFSSDIQTND